MKGTEISEHFVSVSYHYRNTTKCVGLVQSGPHHMVNAIVVV